MKQTAVDWLTVEAMKLFTQAMTGTLNEDTLEDDVSKIITKAKEMEKAEKIKAQIDILKLAHLRLSVEGIYKVDNTMVFTVNELEQQLKLITFKSE